jgi:hypothetical protein
MRSPDADAPQSGSDLSTGRLNAGRSYVMIAAEETWRAAGTGRTLPRWIRRWSRQTGVMARATWPGERASAMWCQHWADSRAHCA